MKRYGLLFLLCCLPHWLYAGEVLNHFLRDLQTLHAQFDQYLYDESGQLLEQSRGKMYVERPNKFRWDYQYPYSQLIVADGKKVWIYDSDLEQVTVKSLDETLGKTPAFLLSRERRVEEDFIVNQLPSKTAQLTRFELFPKDTEATFKSMRISLRGKTLLSFELADNLGQTTYIAFHNLTKNQKLQIKLFHFTPPAGVDVIEDY